MFNQDFFLLDLLPSMVLVADRDCGQITYANLTARQFFLDASPAASPVPLAALLPAIHPADQPTFRQLEQKIRQPGGQGFPLEVELRARREPGDWRLFNCQFAVINEADPAQAEKVLLDFYDITRQKKVEEALRYVSYHDPLTGLYNRAYFDEEARRLEESRIYPVSILMIDVDGMKGVNDRQGHETGDNLLCQIGQVLERSFRHEDVVARIGGDEFAVLLPQVDEAVALAAANSLRQNIEKPSLSIGFATVGKGEGIQSGLRLADSRMYEEKRLHYEKSMGSSPVQATMAA